MELIADEIKLRQDAIAYQVVNKLKNVLKDTYSILYYNFPLYRGDVPNDIIQAKLLLAAPTMGVIYFTFLSEERELNETEKQYLENLDAHIFQRFIKRAELRINKRSLKFGVSAVVISKLEFADDDYIYVQLSNLKNALDKLKQVELNQEEFNILLGCIEGTAKMVTKKVRNVSEVYLLWRNVVKTFCLLTINKDKRARNRMRRSDGKQCETDYHHRKEYPYTPVLVRSYSRHGLEAVRERVFRHVVYHIKIDTKEIFEQGCPIVVQFKAVAECFLVGFHFLYFGQPSRGNPDKRIEPKDSLSYLHQYPFIGMVVMDMCPFMSKDVAALCIVCNGRHVDGAQKRERRFYCLADDNTNVLICCFLTIFSKFIQPI